MNISISLIWSEGTIGIIGFEKGLKEWSRLLTPGGFLVLHEEVLSSDTLLQIPTYGYRLVDYLLLPVDAWWTEFYEPLERRVDELRHKYGTNLEALKLFKRLQNEIEIVKNKPEQFSSAFYILQKVFTYIMRSENRNSEGECYQVNTNVKAVYNDVTHELVSLQITL